MYETRNFHIGAILSITTGFLMPTPDYDHPMDALYDILNFMTQDNLYTHALPRAANECKPYLIDAFPHWPHKVHADQVNSEEKSERFLASCVNLYGAYHAVTQIPRDDHDYIHPIQEAVDLIGEDRVIVIEVADDED